MYVLELNINYIIVFYHKNFLYTIMNIKGNSNKIKPNMIIIKYNR